MDDAMGFAGWLLLRGLAAVVFIVAVVALSRRLRRPRTTVAAGDPAQGRIEGTHTVDPLARQAWIASAQAHVRLARLEDRIRDLEHAQRLSRGTG